MKKAKAFLAIATTATIVLVMTMAIKPGIVNLIEGAVVLTALLPLPLLGQLATTNKPSYKPRHD